MIKILIILCAMLLNLEAVEHKITFYWPSEDGWGTAVADQALMRHGTLPAESWSWPLCAVSPHLLDEYPYGTWLWIDGIGARRVSDCTARWVRNTIDIRVPERYMARYYRDVWVIWKPNE